MANSSSKCTLDNLLKAVLSLGNQDQNAAYPPSIFQQHFNIATSFLISACVKVYPDNPTVVDILAPYVEIAALAIQNGLVNLPTQNNTQGGLPPYRNLLDAPLIYVNPSATGPCATEQPPITTPQQFQLANLRGGCQQRSIQIMARNEFADRTTSDYNYPTHNDPIGYFFESNSIKICPFDVTRVEVMYVRQELYYVYGYIQNPDDTYYFNPATSVESEWGSSAFDPLFKALISMYAAYVSDPMLTDWSKVLNQAGIL